MTSIATNDWIYTLAVFLGGYALGGAMAYVSFRKTITHIEGLFLSLKKQYEVVEGPLLGGCKPSVTRTDMPTQASKDRERPRPFRTYKSEPDEDFYESTDGA